LEKILSSFRKIFRISFSLAWTDFKLRNEGSYLGILWYLLEPLCFFVIILLIGGAISQDLIEQYPLYLFLGLIMFNFFINSTSRAVKSITGNAGLIKSMKINQEVLVASGTFQFIFSHFFEMIIFLFFMIYLGANPLSIVFYLPIFILFTTFIFGVSLIVATIGVYVGDFNNIWSVATRLLWFLTPIFYVMPPSTVFQEINYFNPMFHFINISRQIIIYHTTPSAFALIMMTVCSVFILFLGLFIFRKYKRKFVEMV
jgi:ABC-type polysaccharide/polyol phosphate export permease